MSKLVLSAGRIAPDSPISVELIKTFPDGPPMIVITWPNHKTEVSPAKLAEVISKATRILANASTELSRRRIVPERRS
jgi:hypothetical protein